MLNSFDRILLALLCLAATASAASAQTANRWLILYPDGPTIELDTTTLTKNAEGFPRAWLRFTFQTVHGTADKKYISMKWRIDFNCAKRQSSIVEAIQYAENGEVVADTNQPYTVWTDVVPETVGETALNAFCKTPFARL